MAKFKVRTKSNENISKKARVYFTCHPEDFEKHFEKICEDIFKTHDCSIYYTEDMNESISDDEKEVALGRNNLFVVPITFKLLSTYNRAMNTDIPYAIKAHIPILPIMMEAGIDEFYSKSDKLGEIQYLNPFSVDLTEISYGEKLKKYLDSVLISDELAERVRAAFDAYVFLSYRKKDRKYANQLMKLIHSYPECRNIAIWFDEFLTPGESFKENINKILQSSKLFALLVTPNLLEEPGGNPNFIMSEEYPIARNLGTKIYPVEMQKTDKNILSNKFEGIPECLNPEDEDFKERFIDALSKIAIESNDTPEHNYLLGLAYFEGIDVEVNRELGIELLELALEGGVIEAGEKLQRIHAYAMMEMSLDIKESIYKSYCKKKGEMHIDSIIYLEKMACSYSESCNYSDDYINTEACSKALELYEQAYALRCKVSGKEHPDTITTINKLALVCDKLGKYARSLELKKEVYLIKSKLLGEEHAETLSALNNLACAHSMVGDYDKSLELYEKVYESRCKVLGEEDIDTLISLKGIASVYGKLGRYEKALEVNEKLYEFYCKVTGEESPEIFNILKELIEVCEKIGNHYKTLEIYEKGYALYVKKFGEEHLTSLALLRRKADIYDDLGEYNKAFELHENVYGLLCKILGEEHSDTILELSFCAWSKYSLGEYDEALRLYEKIYTLRCKVLGEEHPDTIVVLTSLSVTYSNIGNNHKALDLQKKAYNLYCKVFGEDSSEALKALNGVARVYENLGEWCEVLDLKKNIYLSRCKAFGEEHADTLKALNGVARAYENLGEWHEALELRKKVYILRCKILGKEHLDTLTSLNNLAFAYDELGECNKALALYERVYAFRCKLLGNEHKKSILALNNMAYVWNNIGNYDKALELYQTVYAWRCKKLGKDHADTLHTLKKIDELQEKIQNT